MELVERLHALHLILAVPSCQDRGFKSRFHFSIPVFIFIFNLEVNINSHFRFWITVWDQFSFSIFILGNKV